MTNPMVSDSSFCSKLVHDADLSVGDRTSLQYIVALTDRFATLEEFLATDENELIQLGITDSNSRACLLNQARRIDEKENSGLQSKESSTSEYSETWLGHKQSTPLNPKSACNLSLGLFSRISFNDFPNVADHHPNESIDPIPNEHSNYLMTTPQRSNTGEPNFFDSSARKTSSTSSHGLRVVKSLSDTISLQKKVLSGADRLKRLALSRSILRRPTAVLRKQISNLKRKLLLPFTRIKTSPKPTILPSKPTINRTPRRILSQPVVSSEHQILPVERGKLQTLSMNHQICRPEEEEDTAITKPIVQPIPTLASKRFKLGAPTQFVTRSLATNNQHE